MSLFTILILKINLRYNRHYRCPDMYITARNTKVLQQASLLAEAHESPYKQTCSYS